MFQDVNHTNLYQKPSRLSRLAITRVHFRPQITFDPPAKLRFSLVKGRPLPDRPASILPIQTPVCDVCLSSGKSFAVEVRRGWNCNQHRAVSQENCGTPS